MRIVVVVIALLVGGWLSFDGAGALAKGDYVTTRAGELGPWARLVSVFGVNPRSTGMKWAHLVLGAMWILSVVLFLTKAFAGRLALLGCSFLTLWYLPLGTVLSIVEIVLLFLPALRSLK